jgi:hypothetical protein
VLTSLAVARNGPCQGTIQPLLSLLPSIQGLGRGEPRVQVQITCKSLKQRPAVPRKCLHGAMHHPPRSAAYPAPRPPSPADILPGICQRKGADRAVTAQVRRRERRFPSALAAAAAAALPLGRLQGGLMSAPSGMLRRECPVLKPWFQQQQGRQHPLFAGGLSLFLVAVPDELGAMQRCIQSLVLGSHQQPCGRTDSSCCGASPQ